MCKISRHFSVTMTVQQMKRGDDMHVIGYEILLTSGYYGHHMDKISCFGVRKCLANYFFNFINTPNGIKFKEMIV